ncbi:ABC transporter permease [Methanosphaera sp. WGK6]|uniref:ABC transporter permease n=1 Tax=Methanosphaera sp. WGK6 TaxID=1561964 RepID=UPI00086A4E3D|nr:ABC transporter permease [Methanosphaera sp. WGK6]
MGLDKLVLPIIIVIAWYIISDVLMLFPSYILPGPLEVITAFINQISSGSLFRDIIDTLYRVLVGMFLAAVVGISLGIVLGESKRLERLCNLIISILRPIPPIAWIPFSILWFGIGTAPAVFIIFMGCVFPILISTIDGVRRTRKVLLEAALSFGASRTQLLTEVILPSTIPYIISALKVAIGVALMCTIAGEMIGSSTGIGHMILTSTNIFDTGSTVVGMLVIGFLGIIFDYIFTKIQERIFW